MSDQSLPVQFTECVELVIPPFQDRQQVTLDLSKIREGKDRLIEAKVVNPATYLELEYTFNESYREAKQNLVIIGYEIAQTEKVLRQIKGEIILDSYPSFIKENKMNDNATNREAFLQRHQPYLDAEDRVNMLKAMEMMFDGNIRVFENVCRYMKQHMKLLERSGNVNHYLSSLNRNKN